MSIRVTSLQLMRLWIRYISATVLPTPSPAEASASEAGGSVRVLQAAGFGARPVRRSSSRVPASVDTRPSTAARPAVPSAPRSSAASTTSPCTWRPSTGGRLVLGSRRRLAGRGWTGSVAPVVMVACCSSGDMAALTVSVGSGLSRGLPGWRQEIVSCLARSAEAK